MGGRRRKDTEVRRGHFDKHGYKCELSSPEEFTGPAEFIEYLQHQRFHLILAIHAYKSGILLIGCKVPYILVLGGTDVNQCSLDPDKMAVMTEAISGARHIVCFGESLKDRFYEKWPLYKQENVTIIPQAVDTNPSEFNIRTFIENNIQPNKPPHFLKVGSTKSNKYRAVYCNNDQDDQPKSQSKQYIKNLSRDLYDRRQTNKGGNQKLRNQKLENAESQLPELWSHDHGIQSHDSGNMSHDRKMFAQDSTYQLKSIDLLQSVSHDGENETQNCVYDHQLPIRYTHGPINDQSKSTNQINSFIDMQEQGKGPGYIQITNDIEIPLIELHSQISEMSKSNDTIEIRPTDRHEEIEICPTDRYEEIEIRPTDRHEEIEIRPTDRHEEIEICLTHQHEEIEIRPTHQHESLEHLRIPSSIRTPPISNSPTRDICEGVTFFTLVGGIRPVKDPLYLVEKFSEWAKTKTFSCYLLIIGPKMEDEYFRYFADKISSVSHVLYIPGLSLEDTHAVIRDSFALVNTSISEGMAISILEAMHLRTPVIVRDIPGNRNVVRHGETGLIFNTVQEFFTEADRLLTDKCEVTKLTENAYRYIVKNHSKDWEERDYIKIAQNCL